MFNPVISFINKSIPPNSAFISFSVIKSVLYSNRSKAFVCYINTDNWTNGEEFYGLYGPRASDHAIPLVDFFKEEEKWYKDLLAIFEQYSVTIENSVKPQFYFVERIF